VSTVAGIDRWRKGWVVAVATGSNVEIVSYPDVATCCDELTDAVTIAIDIPIALPRRGHRDAEVELRQFLGAAGRSVFYSPTRDAIMAPDRASASDLNRELGGPGISAQSWGLSASIRETRAALSPEDSGKGWWETHPETAFTIMNGDTPLASKRSARGVMARLALLRTHFNNVDAAVAGAPDRVPIDDVLDAIAAAWSAGRILNGEARLFGADELDDEGFPLGIRI
jgi:predicted RNase H-like nuclease